MDQRELAELVKQTPSGELKLLMQSERRGDLLDKIFVDMPGVFRPGRAGSTRAVLHWHIADRPDGGVDTYELVIAGGSCTVSATPQHEPRLALTIGAVDFLQMVTGNANPRLLFLRGRIKANGDLGLAMRIPSMFDVPGPDIGR
jgi:hypothetical protein